MRTVGLLALNSALLGFVARRVHWTVPLSDVAAWQAFELLRDIRYRRVFPGP